jgi:thymidylate synthase (FAD)
MIETTSEMTVRLVQHTGTDATIANAARVSVAGELIESQEGEHAGLINYLMAHRHGSPFEHASMTFFIDAPIFVWREFHRHRIGFSYNETSGRYRKLEPKFWLPNPDRKMKPVEGFKSARPKFEPIDTEQYKLLVMSLRDVYKTSYSTYDHLIKQGVAGEVARSVLPVGIYSQCWVTCNPRSLMHFLSLRTHDEYADYVSYPQAEIEEVALLMQRYFQSLFPLTFAAFCKNGRVAP